jgi:hypothetical protein
MLAQMRIHLRYWHEVGGWSREACKELSGEYREVMATEDGFTAVAAHLASVTPHEARILANEFEVRR